VKYKKNVVHSYYGLDTLNILKLQNTFTTQSQLYSCNLHKTLNPILKLESKINWKSIEFQIF